MSKTTKRAISAKTFQANWDGVERPVEAPNQPRRMSTDEEFMAALDALVNDLD